MQPLRGAAGSYNLNANVSGGGKLKIPGTNIELDFTIGNQQGPGGSKNRQNSNGQEQTFNANAGSNQNNNSGSPFESAKSFLGDNVGALAIVGVIAAFFVMSK